MTLADKRNIKVLYLWMLIPFLVMQIGVFPDYWPNFKNEKWGVHVHYWTASAWFIFLIMQPYFISKGNITKHRTIGMIGFLIAGGVIFSALALYPNDIRSAISLENSGRRIAFLEARSFTSLLIAETLLIVAFAFAIIKAIINRKNLEEHAWWLMCSTYFIMLPTVGRGMFYVSEYFVGGEQNLKAWHVDVPSSAVISGLALLMVWRFKKWKHLASWIAILITPIAYILWYQLTQIDAVHEFIKSFIVID